MGGRPSGDSSSGPGVKDFGGETPAPGTIRDAPAFLTHVQNTGAAFGLFPQSNGVFVGLTLAILGLLLKMHRELAAQGILARLGLALVWGGALGNLGDRLRRGAVTDFLDVYWKGWHWPAFNVADSAITVGVSFLLIQNFFAEKS